MQTDIIPSSMDKENDCSNEKEEINEISESITPLKRLNFKRKGEEEEKKKESVSRIEKKHVVSEAYESLLAVIFWQSLFHGIDHCPAI